MAFFVAKTAGELVEFFGAFAEETPIFADIPEDDTDDIQIIAQNGSEYEGVLFVTNFFYAPGLSSGE